MHDHTVFTLAGFLFLASAVLVTAFLSHDFSRLTSASTFQMHMPPALVGAAFAVSSKDRALLSSDDARPAQHAHDGDAVAPAQPEEGHDCRTRLLPPFTAITSSVESLAYLPS